MPVVVSELQVAGQARAAVISLPITQRSHVERFEATERLSELFAIEVDVICEEAEVDFLSHLGEAAEITVSQTGNPQRTFSGLIFEAEFQEEVEAGYRYHLVLRPWLYALTRNIEFKIFQKMTALAIIESVFTKRGCQDFDTSKLQHTYPEREYCVQYRESDFTFVSRLMEQEGIYYYFEHGDGRHKMILCDDPNSHKSVSYDELKYLPAQQGNLDDRVWRWTETVATGAENKATYRDFDFTKPSTQLEGAHDATPPQAAAAGAPDPDNRLSEVLAGEASAAAAAHKSEVYDFPTGFLDNSRGQTLAQTAVEALLAEQRIYRGVGDTTLSACGFTLTLDKHPITRLNEKYLVVGQTYRLDVTSYVSGGDGSGGDQPLVVEILATPAATQWRPPQITPWPVVRGIETAIVVGPDGETIYTDEWGRVKVRFHWDRADPSQDQTCFMRVVFASADNGFGHIVLPRIGQEVVVDFLNGDPDRPIVVGSVYNGEKKPGYALADNKTKSVWRSHTIDGGADDYNEISFEDKNGDEVFNVQAQKDRTTLVKHDDTTKIKNNLSTTIQEGDETREVTKGKRTTTIQQDEALTVKAGNYTIDVTAGKMDVTAKVSITMTVGQNSIKIDQSGITINGIMISNTAKAQFSADAKMTEISGTATTKISGGVVMIN